LFVVERIEGLSFEREGASDVQYIERAGAQSRGVRSRNLPCLFVSGCRKRNDLHDTLLDILAEQSADLLGFRREKLLSEKPESDSVNDFDFSKIS